MQPRRMVLAVTMLASLLAACSGAADRTESSDGDPDSPAAVLDRYTEEAPVDGLFDFTATTLAGDTVDAATYADRQLALWFWAPW